MKELTLKYSVKVIWFYGEPGQGRGLVHTMSPFGCKHPLKYEILMNNTLLEYSSDMVDYLVSYFQLINLRSIIV